MQFYSTILLVELLQNRSLVRFKRKVEKYVSLFDTHLCGFKVLLLICILIVHHLSFELREIHLKYLLMYNHSLDA
jgi:hypothetical protein